MKNTAIDEVTLMMLNSLEAEVKKLIKERDELKQWKSESMAVWGPVLGFMHANGDKLGMRLGESISQFIVRHFQTVADLNDALTKSKL